MASAKQPSPLTALAPVIAEAKPSTASSVKSFLVKSLLPILALVLPGIINGANKTTKKYLREARDVLVVSDLGDEE